MDRLKAQMILSTISKISEDKDDHLFFISVTELTVSIESRILPNLASPLFQYIFLNRALLIYLCIFAEIIPADIMTRGTTNQARLANPP
jgi:hypothetical protein